MFNNFYNIDFDKLAKMNLPFDIRKPNLLRLIGIVFSPLISQYQDFIRWRKQKLYELELGPTVAQLERMLNDRFDYTKRRIKVVDAVWHLPWYLYQDAELKPQYLYLDSENHPIYVYTEGEATIQDDFVVEVPAALVFNRNEMIANVNKWKAAGFHYSIQLV